MGGREALLPGVFGDIHKKEWESPFHEEREGKEKTPKGTDRHTRRGEFVILRKVRFH